MDHPSGSAAEDDQLADPRRDARLAGGSPAGASRAGAAEWSSFDRSRATAFPGGTDTPPGGTVTGAGPRNRNSWVLYGLTSPHFGHFSKTLIRATPPGAAAVGAIPLGNSFRQAWHSTNNIGIAVPPCLRVRPW